MAAVDVDVLQARAEWLGAGQFVGTAQQIAASLGLIGDKADAATQKQLGLAVASGAAAAGIVAFLGKAALAAGEDAAAFGRAANSFRAAGQAFPQAELEAFTGQLEAVTGIADDTIAGTVGLLGSFQLTKQQAMELTPAILDVAEALKAQGVTAESTAVQVGKALQTGNVSGLRRVGIVINDEDVRRVGLFAAVMEGLRKNGEGAAAAFRNTLPGALQAAKTAAGSLMEAIGAPLVGPLTAVANMVTKAATALTKMPGAATAITIALGAAAAAMAYYAFQTANALRQTVLFTAAQARAATVTGATAGATAAGGAARGVGALLGPVALAAGAAAVADMALGATGLTKAGHAGVGGPEDWGRAAGTWIREQVLGKSEAKAKAAAKDDPLLLEQKKQTALLEEQNQIIKGLAGGAPIDVSGTDLRLPEGAMARALRRQVEW
jgi:hypothetical protein